MTNKNEKEFLNEVAPTYNAILPPYSRIKKDIILSVIDTFLVDPHFKRAVQMGCSNGYETFELAKRFSELDVVDGSDILLEKLAKENTQKNIKFICSLFEDYEIENDFHQYDYVICNYVMEHVLDSKSVLRKIENLIKPDGLLFVVVPNANALSRRLALEMGILNSLEELTENDKIHGHRRVYTLESLSVDLVETGWKIIESRGIILKILADFQLNSLLANDFLKEEHIYGLQRLAVDNEEFCDSILAIARRV